MRFAWAATSGFVRDEHDRDAAIAIEFGEQFHHVDAGFHVECARGLVGENQRRVVDQRSRDRHALLLSARELIRIMVRVLRKADFTQRIECRIAPNFFRNAA